MNETTTFSTSPMLHLVFAIVVLFSAALASDTCTVFQIHTIIQGFYGVLSSDECADYASNASSLSLACEATSCVTAVKDLAAKLPDCMLAASDNGGTSANKKMELQNGLDDCSADSSASLSVKAVDTSTSSPTTSTSRTGDECTMVEASTTAKLYLEAAKSSACDPYVMIDDSTMTAYIYAPCSATECVAVMEKMVQQLPDCYTNGANLRDDVLQSLSSCTGSSTAPGSSASFGNQCSNDEVSSLAFLTNSIVKSTECESYVVATSTEWYIAVPCNATTCLATLDKAVDQMPDCEFQGTNYKKNLNQQQQSCVDSVDNDSGSAANSLRTTAPASGDMNSTESSTSTTCTANFGVATLLRVAIMLIAFV